MKKIVPLLTVDLWKKFPHGILAIGFCLLSNISSAQIINEGFEEAEWHGITTSTGGQVIITATSASSTMTYYLNNASSSSSFTTNGAYTLTVPFAGSSTTTGGNSTRTSYTVFYTSTSTNTSPNSGTWWYSRATTATDTKLNKVRTANTSIQMGTSGYIATPVTNGAVVSITFWAAPANQFIAGLNTNTNAVQPTYTSSGTATVGGFTYQTQLYPASGTAGNTFMQSFVYTGSFTGPCRFGIFNASSSSIYIDDIVISPPTGTPPIVTTVPPVNPITPTTGSVTGNIVAGTMPLLARGIIWNLASSPATLDTSLATKTKQVSNTGGNYTHIATGLTPSTNYNTRAYVIDLAGNVYYANIVPFQTSAPTVPIVTTVPPYNILPYKATGGGINIDSGGLAITQKGVCWSTAPSPTTASSKTSDGPNGNNYTSLLRVLAPATHYYVRAYAVNSQGTGYGNQVEFDAASAAPALIASPLSLNFGTVPYNSSATVFSYTLTGYNLTAGGGTINVVPPAGFTVSTAASTGFTSPLPINYTGNSLPTKTIYVKLSTTSYGSFSGYISHNGGGVAVPNADSVSVTGNIIPDPNVTTNAGMDFWTGFGYQRRMDRKAGDASETKMSLYISVPQGTQSATVNVDLPGIPGASGFPKTNINVVPGTVTEITGFPTGDPSSEYNPGGFPDARLYATGITSRGVHIYSTNGVPVSVWMHTYESSNSAAGAMLFPTNTWNNSYTVQAYGGQPTDVANIGGFSNSDNPNSFFFVIANENTTPIWFKPSQDILDSITGSSGTIFTDGHTAAQVKYHKDVEYGPFILNKGQIFNAMGFIKNSGHNVANGLDLSGSTVRTTCDKKIAVFGGNGRVLVNGAGCSSADQGSDHLIQQMFPKVAWGTKYITVPTKTMEHNVFRIYIDSLNTKVWVNDPNHTTPITGLVNGLYYQIQGNSPFLIESDKPINVAQFITTGDCAATLGDKGKGDPEMIILSSVQQAINSATVYSAGIKASSASYNGHYINVVIRKGGIPSFRLDGAAVADTGINQTLPTTNTSTCYNTGGSIPIANAFVKLPYDTNYYVAKFRVGSKASHSLYSDSIFNAIAYGMGDGESYGYNAGTNIKDLTRPLYIDNPYLPNNTNNTTCRNNTLYLKAALPYPPSKVDSIVWYMGSVPGASPQADIIFHSPTPESSYVLDGVTYYVYKNPTPYSFSAVGSYHITGLIGGTFASNCGSTSPFDFNINVVEPGFADFTIDYNPCVNDNVQFTDASGGNGFPITAWQWDFGDATTSALQNPLKVYGTHAVYSVKLRAINSIGCFADTVKTFDMITSLVAKFGVKDTICANTQVTFTDSSSTTGVGVGNIIEWKWTFGETPNTPVITTTNAAQTHTYANPGTYTVTLVVKTSGGCTDTYSKTITVRAVPLASFNMPAGICLPSGLTQFTNNSTISDGQTMAYSWDFGDPSSANNTSTAISPSHTYSSTGPFNVHLIATSQYGCVDDSLRTLSNVYPQPTAIISAPASACLKDTVQFTDASTAGTGNTVTQWAWTFGDGGTSTVQNPKHPYYVTGNQTVTLTVTSDKGCTSTTTSVPINIKPLPNAVIAAMANVCLNAAAVPVQATETTGMSGSWTYTGTGVSGTTFTPSTAGVGTFPIIATYSASNGCKDADTTSVTVMPLPVPAFTVGASTCERTSISFTDNSTPNATSIQAWDWNFSDAPTSSAQSPTHNFLTAGSYTVTLTVTNSNNCTASLPQTVVVHNRPFADFSLPASVCLPDGGATFTNLSTVADDANPSFAWNFGDPSDATGSSLTNPTHHYSTTGPFTVLLTVTSKYGCVKDTTHTLTSVHPEPPADFTALPFEVCLGDAIVFTGQSANNAVSWNWSFADGNTSSIKNTTNTYASAGTFNVDYYYTDAFGCRSKTVSKPVIVHPYPVMDAGPNQYVLQGNGVTLKATASGTDLKFLWTPSTFLNYDTLLNPVSVPTAEQLYTLRVTDLGGCYKEDTVRVFLLKEPEIPNAFSPNGDGINDKWEIGQLVYYAGCTVEIFNRNGQKLFSSVGYANPWDGSFSGRSLPVGTYYYIINPKNGHKVISGNVTILR